MFCCSCSASALPGGRRGRHCCRVGLGHSIALFGTSPLVLLVTSHTLQMPLINYPGLPRFVCGTLAGEGRLKHDSMSTNNPDGSKSVSTGAAFLLDCYLCTPHALPLALLHSWGNGKDFVCKGQTSSEPIINFASRVRTKLDMVS